MIYDYLIPTGPIKPSKRNYATAGRLLRVNKLISGDIDKILHHSKSCPLVITIGSNIKVLGRQFDKIEEPLFVHDFQHLQVTISTDKDVKFYTLSKQLRLLRKLLMETKL